MGRPARSEIKRTNARWRWRLPRLLAGVALVATLSGCITRPAGLDEPAPFDTHEFRAATDQRVTILVGHFSAGEFADVALFYREDRGVLLELFRFDGARWSSAGSVPVSERIDFVDKVDGVERDYLLGIGRDRLVWIDPDGGARLAAEVSLNLPPESPDDVPRLAIARDLNGDAMGDIVLPSVAGFDVRLQQSPGVLEGSFSIPAPEPFREQTMWGDEQTYAAAGITAQTNPWYQARLYRADISGDGREDLVVWREGAFDVYRQLASGAFDPRATVLESAVPFAADGVYTLAFAISGEGLAALMLGLRPAMEHTALRSFEDVNGDAIPDLTTVTFAGKSVIRLKRRIAVHYGRRTSNGLVFEARADTSVVDPRRTAFGYQSAQFRPSPNGGTDVLVGHVSTGATQIFRVFVGNTIAVDLALYRLRDGVYPDEPSASYALRPGFRPFDRRGPFFPTALFGDVTGDGIADLLVARERDTLTLHRGRGDDTVIEREGIEIPFEVTNNEIDAQLVRWRRDGPLGVISPRVPSPDRPGAWIGILMPRPSGGDGG